MKSQHNPSSNLPPHLTQFTPPPINTKDPNLMTNEERLAEITQLLTRAVVRYCRAHSERKLEKKSQARLTQRVVTSVHQAFTAH